MLRTVRSLSRDPMLVMAAGVTLAVSIAANTTLFSVANSIFLRPLPYPEPQRILWIGERSGPAQQEIGTFPDYYRIRKWNRVFDDVAALNPMTADWTGVDRPEQLDVTAVTSSFFHLMGSQPTLGRYFGNGEDGPHAAKLAVLSYAFWQSRLGGDRNVIGRRIELDRETRTIIGVMPQGFDYPHGTQLWLPARVDEATEGVLSPAKPILTASIIARSRADVSPQAVEADLKAIAERLRVDYHVFATKFRWDLAVSATPLADHLAGPVRPVLDVLGGAAGLVLLIACVNLANLLLARAGNRQRELAVRLALGASRRKIFSQVLGESLWLAVPGGVAGIALAWVAVDSVNRARPAMLLRYPPVSMDWRVLAFTLILTLGAAVLFGLAPGISAAGIRVHESLKSGGMTHSGGPGSSRLRKLLLGAELAISVVLLIGAGLLARTFLNLTHTELGFRTDHLLTFRVNPIGRLDHDFSWFHQQILDRVRQLPMVRSAAILTDIPLSSEDFYINGRIRVVGRDMVPFDQRPRINNTVVSPEFFQTLGIPLRSGRVFDAHDFVPGTRVTNYGMSATAKVVVNEAFVRRLFPGESPIGREIIFGPDQNSVAWTIIGVVGDVRGAALGSDPPAMIYRCTCEGGHLYRAAYALRTSGDPKAILRVIEEQVRGVDRDQPLFDIKTMEERRADAMTPERIELGVIGAFALIAILLAAAGVYGVTSYLVTRRTREIGIRVAMGARPSDVLEMVFGEAISLTVVSAAAGIAGAWALTRFIRHMLYGVKELDAVTFCIAPALLAVIVLLACFMPARHASQIDPAKALRDE